MTRKESRIHVARFDQAVEITNNIHKHARLTGETAIQLLQDGATSHPVYQTLVGAMGAPA